MNGNLTRALKLYMQGGEGFMTEAIAMVTNNKSDSLISMLAG